MNITKGGNKMFIKTLFSLGTALLISPAAVQASAITINDPIDLAKKQEMLSTKIATGYSEHKDISQVLHQLEEQQIRLKKSIHDPEITNMIDFLQLCLRNIKNINQQPHTLRNTEKIADLGASINEGSRYIVQKLN
jgi:hypothetical protein